MRSLIVLALIFSLITLGVGCGMTKAQKGAAIGVGGGAAVGGAIGKTAGNTAAGAVAGAAVGGIAGGLIGKYMDKQAQDIQEEVKDAKVERTDEGIQITFDSAILFDVNKSELKPETKDSLTRFSEILKKYPDTNLLIEGHTDSTGSDDYNLKLSKQRAQSVSDYLSGLGVTSNRFSVVGHGESKPVATNDTQEGRQLNRRVEISITPNEKLKEEAAKEN
jgi:outer membrane protein OmpA-like peptidoglycan-associated protein